MWSGQATDGVDGEWEWGESTSLGRKMASLESSLRCSICSEFFTNPHSLSCGHVFCSECIRRHLDPKMNHTTAGICPSCRETASLPQLRPCRDVVLTLQHFKDVRQPLLLLIKSQETSSFDKICNETMNNVTPLDMATQQSTTKKLSHMDFHKQSKEKVKKALERLTEKSRKKLRLDGDKDTLERRYRDFVHLNNAQLGNSNPLSLEQMVTEITKRENARNGNSRRGMKSAQIAKDLKNGKCSAEAKQGFSSLMEQIRSKKNSIKSAPEESAGESNSSVLEASVPSDSTAVDNKGGIVDRGIWRVVHSKKFDAPFFYNTVSDTGQFEVPSDLKGEYGVEQVREEFLETCSPTQRKNSGPCSQRVTSFSQTQHHNDDGVVSCTYQNMSSSEQSYNDGDGVSDDQLNEESSNEKLYADDSGHPDFPCTLLDTQVCDVKSVGTELSKSVSKHGECNSEYDNAYSRSTLDQEASYSSSTCHPGNSREETPAEDHVTLEEENNAPVEQNECPFCTFLNPPLALVCEICLGEITQKEEPIRRSQRIEAISSQKFSSKRTLSENDRLSMQQSSKKKRSKLNK